MKKTMAMVTFALSLLSVSGLSAKASFPLSEQPVTVYFIEAGVRDAIASLMLESGYQYKLDNSISNKTKVTLKLQEEKWSTAFEKILKQGKLSYTFDNSAVMTIKKR